MRTLVRYRVRMHSEPVVPGLPLEREQELLGRSFLDRRLGDEVPVPDEVARLGLPVRANRRARSPVISEPCLFLRGSSGAIGGLSVAGRSLRRLAPVEGRGDRNEPQIKTLARRPAANLAR